MRPGLGVPGLPSPRKGLRGARPARFPNQEGHCQSSLRARAPPRGGRARPGARPPARVPPSQFRFRDQGGTARDHRPPVPSSSPTVAWSPGSSPGRPGGGRGRSCGTGRRWDPAHPALGPSRPGGLSPGAGESGVRAGRQSRVVLAPSLGCQPHAPRVRRGPLRGLPRGLPLLCQPLPASPPPTFSGAGGCVCVFSKYILFILQRKGEE